ncbi:MAG: ORF6N domain-containing protein [Acidobacteriota bacterium]
MGASVELQLAPAESVERKILLIRGQKVILDSDLAVLYGVPTKALNQAVRRNKKRFPPDFMFRLTMAEARHLWSLRSQFVTLKRGQHLKYPPYAFTEQGVAMLSSVLNSERAIRVNITIMRIFVRLREFLADNADLARKLDAIERKYDTQFEVVFDAIRQLMKPAPPPPQRRIGFLAKAGLPV